MALEMDFRILGPLEIYLDGWRIPVPAGKQRILLATLLLHVNEIVSVEELVERLWDGDLPDRPRRALQIHLTRMRRIFEGCDYPFCSLIRTSAAGYTIEIDPEDLDLTRFRRLVERARRACEGGDLVAESGALAAALAQWRGPVLPDVNSTSLHRDVIPRLTEEWMSALGRRNEIDLALGRHDELIGELRALTSRHPFREPFWRQLILALYRSGRRFDALQAYGELRAQLRDELGVDPSSELQHLHVAILRSDPALVLADNMSREFD